MLTAPPIPVIFFIKMNPNYQAFTRNVISYGNIFLLLSLKIVHKVLFLFRRRLVCYSYLVHYNNNLERAVKLSTIIFTHRTFTKFLFLFGTNSTTSPTSFRIVYLGKCYPIIQIINYTPFLVNFIIHTPTKAMYFMFKIIFNNCTNFMCVGLSQPFFRQKKKNL